MTQAITFEDIRQFLASNLERPESVIHPDSLLVKDLGVTWERSLVLLPAFSSRYGVDILDCDVKAHFMPFKPDVVRKKAYIIVDILSFLFGAFTGDNPYARLPRRDVSVVQLLQYANDKKWPKVTE